MKKIPFFEKCFTNFFDTLRKRYFAELYVPIVESTNIICTFKKNSDHHSLNRFNDQMNQVLQSETLI